jgi:hypothetical protein
MKKFFVSEKRFIGSATCLLFQIINHYVYKFLQELWWEVFGSIHHRDRMPKFCSSGTLFLSTFSNALNEKTTWLLLSLVVNKFLWLQTYSFNLQNQKVNKNTSFGWIRWVKLLIENLSTFIHERNPGVKGRGGDKK